MSTTRKKHNAAFKAQLAIEAIKCTNMSKTIAFYDPYITGHHVEYLYHIANFKINNDVDTNFIFFVRKEFDNQINQLISVNQLKRNDLEIIHIEDILKDQNFKFEQSLGNYKKQLLFLNKIIKAKKIDHCVFMYLDNAMQIALSTSAGKNLNCKISGIVFNPFGGFGKGIKKYYYSFRRILQNYFMLSNRKISAVYIIIDKKSVNRLNFMHFTKKFQFVSDPVLKTNYFADNKPHKKTDPTRKTFLLFGSLNKRKGIFKILNAINKLNLTDLNKIKIIFAGKLAENDKGLFLNKYNELLSKDRGSLELLDRFITFEEIPDIFIQSDFVLLPYDTTQASSGILGHAAYYEKPVIGQGGGIFEKHVNRFGLGKTIKNMEDEELFEIIKGIIDGYIIVTCNQEGAKRYIDSRSSEFFASTIIKTALI